MFYVLSLQLTAKLIKFADQIRSFFLISCDESRAMTKFLASSDILRAYFMFTSFK
jgi:hypothetical protein